MAGNTYAVIGSNCFTGSHIVDALLERGAARVIGVSRSPEYRPLFLPYTRFDGGRFVFRQVDIVRQPELLFGLLDEERPATVINVAALSEVALSNTQPVEYFEVNTVAVARLCNHLRTTPYLQRYVHISSAEIFGSCPAPADEQALFDPSTPYAASKAAADMFLKTVQKNFGFPVLVIRSTNVYGRHQQLFKIIPRTVISVKLGRPTELHGGGRAMKSFVHVRDVVRGLLAALDRERTGTYHFTVQSEETVADVVRLVCRRLGADFDAVTRPVGERLGQDARYILDARKAACDLGWAPQVPLERGVGEVVDWVDANWSEIQNLPLTYQHKV